jgi:N-acetyl-gamma-glutamyl-phosphate reductase
MGLRVAVAGCTGYAGGEALRLLLGHPEVEIGALTAGDSAGRRLGEFHPHLYPLAQRPVVATTPENLAGHDVVFMALPSGASAAVAAGLADDVLALDCGADHRLTSADDWARFYAGEYAAPWDYGMAEIPGQREILARSKRIAVPGCYVTCVTLSLLPALVAGVIDGRDVVATAASGTSGAGKSPKPHLLGAELFGSVSAYGVGGSHRHIPEILQNLRLLGAAEPTLTFTPMLAPMSRGILAVTTAPTEASAGEVRAAYAAAYAAEPFAELLPEGQWPTSKQTAGGNAFVVQVAKDESSGRLVAVGALDNLVKGTAGQAIQAMNLALGLPEETGLTTVGVAP